ncbi:hypothetical protein [Ferrimicrobium acidiphilum]|uniref:hypothetical protein n=2 Tax=Ferrimicrobium acidiphilum TaxID=121039 RepID=UPI0023F1CFFB|nr:hypothetical protein [Ferrimicrobium acidiphilum]
MSSIHGSAGNGCQKQAMSLIDSAARIESYRPAFPEKYWEAIEPFVRALMRDVQQATAHPVDAMLSVVAQYVLWARQAAGLPLDREILLQHEVIEEFISRGCQGIRANSRATYRSRLLLMRKILFEANGIRVKPATTPFPAADPASPYTGRDLAALRSWADGQHTASRIRSAKILLALGAGAGLRTEDIVRLSVSDVQVDNFGVLINVRGRRPRSVPVLAEWEEAIKTALDSIPKGKPLFGEGRTSYNKNAVSNFLSRRTGVGLKPSLARLRITWIVHHLRVGTPIVPLMQAAGIATLDAFDRYLAYVPDVGTLAFRVALRGAMVEQMGRHS